MNVEIELRPATSNDWPAVADLIYTSTNDWYVRNGKSAIFTGDPSSTLLFCEVYEDLDPGHCLLAVDAATGALAGSCFYRERETHVSLGIMNAHSDYAGQGVARRLLAFIKAFAESKQLPLRLVSSAMNLDSFSLYNRAGFAPYAVYQDMMLTVPDAGIADEIPADKRVRDATPADVTAMVELEAQVLGIRRAKDFAYFIANQRGDWHVSVIETADGQLTGFLASIHHPGSALLGPGCMRSDADAIALIRRELHVRRGQTMVWLVPSNRPAITKAMYGLGAKNCELHLAQTTGTPPPITGVIMPSFMPETA
jgi:GNAT superfamily N-acetyltransferase